MGTGEHQRSRGDRSEAACWGIPGMEVVDAQCNIKGNLAAQALPPHCLRVVAQRTIQVATLSMHHTVCCVVPTHSARQNAFRTAFRQSLRNGRSHSVLWPGQYTDAWPVQDFCIKQRMLQIPDKGLRDDTDLTVRV